MVEHAYQLPAPEEPPSGSSPINATSLRRGITLCALALLGRVRKRSGNVVFLTDRICVKYGSLVDLSEAASQEFVRKHTSIPVPKVFCAFTRRGWTYIVMQRIKGHKLAIGWRDRSEQSRARILAEVKAMVEEMRALKSPHGAVVASVDGGSLFDLRLPGLGVHYPVPTAVRYGPFDDVATFHQWLRRPVRTVDDKYTPEVNELIALHESADWGTPVFTHGDLSSLNILVRGDKVVGIVDWETAGWLPSYWEYATASQVNFRNEFWAEYIDRFLDPKPEGLRMDRLRMQCFGDS